MIKELSISTQIELYYIQKHPFPEGIQEAWKELEINLTNFSGLHIYGIYDGKEYFAGCTTIHKFKCSEHTLSKQTIPPGEYLYTSMNNWKEKINNIPLLFKYLEHEFGADRDACDIEYYKSENELICLKRKLQ